MKPNITDKPTIDECLINIKASTRLIKYCSNYFTVTKEV